MSASYSRPPTVPRAEAAPVESRLAYIKAMRSERVGFLSAEAPLLGPGRTVFVLYTADGTPIEIADSAAAAAAEAASYQLEPVTLH
jgi:hypothetical protein